MGIGERLSGEMTARQIVGQGQHTDGWRSVGTSMRPVLYFGCMRSRLSTEGSALCTAKQPE